ncbi:MULTISPECIES: murein biosynthesis integral membrane protein MurJ [unclassified Janibacter]|uniref:murein biosynthesis integral membrane protein MurJ n=1 Tax=unclassified Janibacter TaxID=2649294 RepID=UPI003D07AA17
MSSDTLARSSAVMAAGTLVSRVLGLLRNSLTAAVVGVTIIAADAWNAANTLPNLFHLLLAGGVLNAVIVPQIIKAMKHDDGGQEFVNRLLTVAMALMAVATIVLTAAAPLLVAIVTDAGWSARDRGLATTFAFLCLPQMFFYGLYTLLGQVLNARGRFGAYMWAPALANVVAIAGLLWFLLTDQPLEAAVEDWTPQMIAVLAGSTTLSIVLQALVLIPPLRRIGFRYRPVWGLRGSGLGAASRMAMWAFAAVCLSQAGYIVTSRVLTGATHRATAAGVDGAGLTAYSNAFLIFMLPHSLITVSLVTALFTRLSHAAGARDTELVTSDLRRGLRLPAVVLIPGSAAIILLAPLVTQVILFGNAREQTDTLVPVLIAMFVGLLPFGWYYLVQRVYYAYEDGRTPFLLQIVATTLAVAFTLYGGTRAAVDSAMWVGIGQTVSNLAAALLGFWLLRRKVGPLGVPGVARQHVRLLLATALATLVGWVALQGMNRIVGEGLLGATVTVATIGPLVVGLALGIAALLHVREVAEMADPVLRRLRLRG